MSAAAALRIGILRVDIARALRAALTANIVGDYDAECACYERADDLQKEIWHIESTSNLRCD